MTPAPTAVNATPIVATPNLTNDDFTKILVMIDTLLQRLLAENTAQSERLNRALDRCFDAINARLHQPLNNNDEVKPPVDNEDEGPTDDVDGYDYSKYDYNINVEELEIAELETALQLYSTDDDAYDNNDYDDDDYNTTTIEKIVEECEYELHLLWDTFLSLATNHTFVGPQPFKLVCTTTSPQPFKLVDSTGGGPLYNYG